MPKDGVVIGLIARRRDRLAEVLADCQKHSPDSTMWVADLADSASVVPLAQQAAEALGGIDVLVNNEAIPKRRLVTLLYPFKGDTILWGNSLPPFRATLAFFSNLPSPG